MREEKEGGFGMRSSPRGGGRMRKRVVMMMMMMMMMMTMTMTMIYNDDDNDDEMILMLIRMTMSVCHSIASWSNVFLGLPDRLEILLETYSSVVFLCTGI